jgi:poly-gamma-glutamate synthesis protein (capsule biosynthesis protein)
VTGVVPGVAAALRVRRHPGDVAVVSIHWGDNWGFAVPAWQRELAHRLIEQAGVDVVHGHSSHHVKGIEVHRGRLILYGCGDLLTDYEGITGREAYHGDVGALYLATLDAGSGELLALRLVPMRMERLRLRRAADADARWLRDTLSELGGELGTRARLDGDGQVALRWGAEG